MEQRKRTSETIPPGTGTAPSWPNLLRDTRVSLESSSSSEPKAQMGSYVRLTWSAFTCRERQECFSLHELPVGVQKVSGVEGVWSFPLGLVEQHRGQERHQGRTLGTRSTVTHSKAPDCWRLFL